MNIEELVNQIIADGKLTKEEHQMFLDKVNEDGKVDEEENKQISRLMDMIGKGELKVE